MNAGEREVYELLRERGCKVYTRGWPDFLVVSPDGSRTFGLEVKAGFDRLRGH
jgi:hypothetical protein